MPISFGQQQSPWEPLIQGFMLGMQMKERAEEKKRQAEEKQRRQELEEAQQRRESERHAQSMEKSGLEIESMRREQAPEFLPGKLWMDIYSGMNPTEQARAVTQFGVAPGSAGMPSQMMGALQGKPEVSATYPLAPMGREDFSLTGETPADWMVPGAGRPTGALPAQMASRTVTPATPPLSLAPARSSSEQAAETAWKGRLLNNAIELYVNTVGNVGEQNLTTAQAEVARQALQSATQLATELGVPLPVIPAGIPAMPGAKIGNLESEIDYRKTMGDVAKQRESRMFKAYENQVRHDKELERQGRDKVTIARTNAQTSRMRVDQLMKDAGGGGKDKPMTDGQYVTVKKGLRGWAENEDLSESGRTNVKEDLATLDEMRYLGSAGRNELVSNIRRAKAARWSAAKTAGVVRQVLANAGITDHDPRERLTIRYMKLYYEGKL